MGKLRLPTTKQSSDVTMGKRKRRPTRPVQQTKRRPRRTNVPRKRKGETWHRWYGRYLRCDHWLKTRAAALARGNHACAHCGTAKRLQVHHLTYRTLRNERPQDLIVLCEACHRFAHGLDTDDPISREFREIMSAH